MFCSHCGKSNPDTARFCNSCGGALPKIQPMAQGDFLRTNIHDHSPRTRNHPRKEPPKKGSSTWASWWVPGCVVLAGLLLIAGDRFIKSLDQPPLPSSGGSTTRAQTSSDNRPTETSTQQATMAKMSDKQLLDSASRLLAGKNVSEITVAHENEAAMYLREFARRHPQNNDARAEKIGDRLVAVTLARNMARRAALLDANPPAVQAQVVCRLTVERNLKAPDSADFQSSLSDPIKYLGKGKFHIQTKAYAMNSFGARLQHTFDCKVQCLDADNCSVTSLSEID